MYTNNETPRRGGFRKDENPREHFGANTPNDNQPTQRRQRPRFTRSSNESQKVTNDYGYRSDYRYQRSDNHPQRNDRQQRDDYQRNNRYKRDEQRPQRDSYRSQQGEYRQQSHSFSRNSSVYSQRKQHEYRQKYEDPTKPIRLNKYLANAGICSRREADDFIQAGVITVNGEVVSSLGTKVLPTDKVMFHNQPVKRERKVYILLNKPKNTVTTTDDPEDRHTVIDIVKNACSERIYPVGRLDRNTTGVLLLTNDGDLAAKLTHPKFGKKKIYAVTLDKELTEEDEQIIRDGVVLDDERIVPDALEFPKGDRLHIGLEIHSGQNRVVRRIFEKTGYRVVALDRVSFAGLTKRNVPRGKYRFLTPKEVSMLQMGAFE